MQIRKLPAWAQSGRPGRKNDVSHQWDHEGTEGTKCIEPCMRTSASAEQLETMTVAARCGVKWSGRVGTQGVLSKVQPGTRS